MAGDVAAGEYKDVVVFLAAAGVAVPLLNRLKISPVLAFLAAGVALGPDGLGRFADQARWLAHLTISDRSQTQLLSELGVVFLLFMIGLELSWERLKAMRKLVFGLGAAQIAVCAALIAGGFLVAGQTVVSATILGIALALSSTAVVMPVLAERGRLKGATGRSVFAILLAQDLAVAPILVTVSVLAAALAGAGGGVDPTALAKGLWTLVPAALGLGAIVLLGRLLLRPMFRSVAKAQSRQLFLATCLLVVLGTGLLASLFGLSMSLGALIAGVLLAETEYRRQVEVVIEPFQGLLLGLFFVSTGVGLDLDAIAAHPVGVFGVAAAVTAAKAVAIFALAKGFRVPTRTALETALVLGPAGEFAFVIVGQAMGQGVVPADVGTGVLISATLSLFAVPFLAMLATRLRSQIRAATGEEPPSNAALEAATDPTRVLIVGYGRVGKLVGEMLGRHQVPFAAVDSDAGLVARERGSDVRIWFGDAGGPAMLKASGVEKIDALVVTMDAPAKVDDVVRAARALRKDLIILARARDERHAARLYALGVTDAAPETTEAALQLAENTLVDLGIPMGVVLASVHDRRDEFRTVFQAAAPGDRKRPTRALRTGRVKA